ncbi:MAG: gliding motility-associated C-terminal domain-containing protein, partial [Cyclobacteriaceae bacterium]|nr:gliding motility-associated C-terminal domain-containing protein [Cyclobacteriaceae bacterium]
DTGIGGNAVASKFTYTVSSTNPLSVFPESNRNVATTAQISHVYSNFSGVDETITYVVTPFSTAGDCQGSTFEFKIIVHPEPVGSNLNDPVCSTTLNHNIQTQITNGLNSIFTYTVSSDNGGVPAGPNRVAASNAPITDVYVNGTGSPANIVYTITPFNAANPTCQGSVFTYTVNISPNPTGVSDTKPAVCSDVPFSIDPQGNIVPAVASTFTWTATYDAPMTGPASGSGVIAGAIHNETNLQLFAHYTVTPTAGTCVGAPFTIDLPINPEPVMEPTLAAPPAVCSSNAVSTTPIGVILQTNGVSVAADSYIVTLKSQDAGLVGIATTGTFAATIPIAGQSDAISNDTYRNTTSAQLKVVYTIVPQSVDGCMGDAFDITILVNPEPVLTNPGFPDVCSSNSGISNPVNIVLGTNGTSATAANYQLQDIQYSDGGPFGPALPPSFTANASNAAILGAPGTINILKNDRYTNRSPVPVTIRYTVQGYSSQNCPSEFLDYEVVINPEPVLDPALSPAPVCSDVASGVTLGVAPGSVAAATYNINNIIRQAGLVAGGSNASIGLGQGNLAIFNDTFTNTTAGPLTVTYKVVPVSAAGCLGVEADVVFTVNPAPAVANNLDKTVCTNEVSGIMFATAGSSAPAASYNIVNVAIQGGLTQTAGNTGARLGVASNEIQNDQFENLGNVPLTVTYTVQGVTGATCIGPQKDIILTVEPTITAVPVNNIADICSGTQTDIDLTSPTLPTSGTITFNYTAVSSIGGQMTGFVPALNNLPLGYKITDNLVNNSNSVATLTYTITPVANGAKSGAGCLGVPVPVVVNVEPKPKLVASPLVQTICESDGVNVSPTNILLTSATVPSVGTLEFNQISAVPTGGMTLLSPVKTTYINGESITDQWDNPTLTDQTVTYTLRPEVSGGLGCPGDDVVVTVTIKPRPIISPVAPQSVCSGEFRSIPLVTDIPGTFATWTVSAPATITGALNGGGNNLDITLFNSGFNVETVTYTVTPKFNNCDGIPINIVVTVNPTPNTVGLPATITVCDGATLNVPLSSGVAGTTFDWVVTDVFNLEAPGFFDGNGTTINQVVNNPNGFQAVLIYQVTPTSPDGCVGLPRIMNVNVGSIVANVTPDRTDICSGQRIQMTNSSLGATSHRWFYRVQGTTTEIDVRTTPFVNYQLDNTTSTNPLVYEIVYQASNGLCTVPDVVTPITVYRNVVAGFDEGTVPAIIGGTSTVNFTNTSNPNDGAQFRYEWDFGSSTFATPSTFVGATPPPVVYSQQGPYQVTLKAINIAAETAGLQCESTFFKNIVVPVLPLIADFTLDPPAACFPTTVKVIENLSTGDIMEWKVVDSNGKVVAVSGADLPEFFISTPGLFNVQLTTRDSFTDAVEFANTDFEVFSIPVASFQARPTTVFVPDTEMTTFNFSTGAEFYQWDFGDGETSDEREPKHTYKIEGVYDIVMVAGFDHGGGIVCTDTLTQQVVAKQGGQTKIPNAFTPNPGGPSGGVASGGSFNDVFLPIVKGVEEFNMQIFDRWGNLIFESNSSNTGWDGYDKNGNILPAGVYIYKLTLRLSDGQRTTQIGDITMIR